MNRRAFLASLSAAAVVGCSAAPRPAAPSDEPIARGARWLLARQAPDGAFRSATYGVFAEGQSLTALAAVALGRLDDRDFGAKGARSAAIEASIRYALSRVDASGALGFAATAPDYPTYATALATLAIARSADPGRAGRLVSWLDGAQLTPERGWAEHPGLGGFPMGYARVMTPPHPGHVDLSMTRRAAQALAAVGRPPDHPSLALAAGFARRCRTPDGGFVYTPVEPRLNKGSPDPVTGASRGYGSATSDGVLTLLACGAPPDDRDVAAGAERLRAMHRVDANPGLEGGPMAPFASAMVGYYRAGAAEVFAALGGPPDWAAALISAIAAEQHPDGSWRNASDLQKEDDPIVATCLALIALAASR